ncbi:hypothetical protein, partial [Catellatospora chokoriensis]|uniref:hypothetical protein n=1 Tax=Catellatospora chokoriensis TaxID=310353 RepID=UPI0031D7881C
MRLPPGNPALRKQLSDLTGEASGAAGDAVLGTVANSIDPPPGRHGASGATPEGLQRRLIRAERFALLSEGRRLLLNEGRREGLRWHHKI